MSQERTCSSGEREGDGDGDGEWEEGGMGSAASV